MFMSTGARPLPPDGQWWGPSCRRAWHPRERSYLVSGVRVDEGEAAAPGWAVVGAELQESTVSAGEEELAGERRLRRWGRGRCSQTSRPTRWDEL